MSDNPELQAILAELRDTQKEKRRLAVMKLGMVGGDEAIRILIQTVENQYEDLIVRGRAAKLLGKIGDATAVTSLIRALDAPGYQTPLSAVEALGNLGDIRAIDPLVHIANSRRDRIQQAAIESLDKLGYDYHANHPDDDESAQPQPELEL